MTLETINPLRLREARYLSKLEHPNVVRYYSTWLEFKNNTFNLYIQMELCDKTLKQYIAEHKKKKEKIIIFYNIVKGIQYLHSQGIIHRDIKPSNILIREDKNNSIPKITDFGLSYWEKFHNIIQDTYEHKLLLKNKNKQSLTKEIGTELYSSPEQLKGDAYEKSTDIYSLGIIYFELLSKFNNNFERIDQIQDLRSGDIDWNKSSITKIDQNLINKMISTDPSKRISADKIIEYFKKRIKRCD